MGSNPTPSAGELACQQGLIDELAQSGPNIGQRCGRVHGMEIDEGGSRYGASRAAREGRRNQLSAGRLYAGRDGAGRDEYVRQTLTGVSRREATKAHAQLVVDV